ncbi:SpoIIE family protein phosphatase [Streptomyces sp. NPDC059837]|uniref:ATP-binding SpoIIE family protein phosphatase n=1 Tax=unclassified Streptomyces TaxID=2593676 RepID=UPI002259E9FF|nr:ATP-binding SpoIIE family protein phosphatase [Streptomyces sp. NBC_00268]MCX5184551.1 SpoIIE family protein phosphatase [Streptomyces sp. NBC_00268]
MALAPGMPAHYRVGQEAIARAALPGTPLAPGAARRMVREALADWGELALPGAEIVRERLAEDTVLVVSELVTNAVVHAGTDVELLCRLEITDGGAVGAVVVEVSDHHPSRAVREEAAERAYGTPEYGRGLRLVATLSEAWGITYRTGVKTVWARLPVDGGLGVDEGLGVQGGLGLEGGASVEGGLGVGGGLGVEDGVGVEGGFGVERGLSMGEGLGADRGTGIGPGPAGETVAPGPRQRPRQDGDWLNRGALSFLAEASDLLAGQLDEDLVAALAGQLLVPRLADWCAVWLEDEATDRAGGLGLALGPRLARVWHGSENRIEELRRDLEKDPPRLPDSVRSRAVPVPWPGEALGTGQVSGEMGGAGGADGAALAYRLIAGGRPLGTLVIGRAGLTAFPDEITGLVEDLSRRIALAIGAARQYARQATISRVLQRGLLPGAVAEIPGVRSALVYEPLDKGGPSGDFYDLFPAGDGRWCFVLGDVQGKGPEAAVVIGLARPWVRLLAREGYHVADVLDRLNQLLLDDATEAADAAARALVAAGGPGLGPDEGPQTRFLSMLYGELVPFEGGVRCTLASAGHPLPLILGPDGDVREVAEPQTLLGVFEDATYVSETFDLYPGDTVLCVTDGVTERRSGPRQFDDDEGLAEAFAGCTGLSAELVAERIRRLVHEFGSKPPEDDLALLVLQAE